MFTPTFKCFLSSVLLAAMHYNENADRPLAFTAQNEPQYRVAFSRSNYGDAFIRQEKTEPTYGKLFSANYRDASLIMIIPDD